MTLTIVDDKAGGKNIVSPKIRNICCCYQLVHFSNIAITILDFSLFVTCKLLHLILYFKFFLYQFSLLLFLIAISVVVALLFFATAIIVVALFHSAMSFPILLDKDYYLFLNY